MKTPESELARARANHNSLLERRAALVPFDQQVREADREILLSNEQIRALEAVLASEASRARARAATKLLPEFRGLGERFDQLMIDMLACYGALKSIATELRDATGVPHPRGFVIGCRTALGTSLMHSDLQQQLVAPLARRSMGQIIDAYAKSVEAAATGRPTE
jgi:hypothetical protein